MVKSAEPQIALQLLLGAEVKVQFWAEAGREQKSAQKVNRRTRRERRRGWEGKALTLTLSRPTGEGNEAAGLALEQVRLF
jgi:hypothetical protein